MVTLAVPETVNSKYPLSAFPISVEVTAVTSEFVRFVIVPFVAKYPSANVVPDTIASLSAFAVSVVASNSYVVSVTGTDTSAVILYTLAPLLRLSSSGETNLYVPSSRL